MGLKIVISASRYSSEKQSVISELKKLNTSQRTIIEHIYDCEEYSTVIGDKSKQEGINGDIIPTCDWFILLAPLNHVGRQTALEFLAACLAFRNSKYPIISIFHCKNPYNGEDLPQQLSYSPKNKDVKVNCLLKIASRLLHTGHQYDVDYGYNKDDSSLKYHIIDQYNKIYKEKLFHIQQFSHFAHKGETISAKELYYDKKRAEEQFGFCQNLYFPRESVDGKVKEAIEAKTQIIVITGVPGSGKTRAMYECIHTILSHENVIILNPENIDEVTERMIMFNEKEDNNEETFYLVCDQIKDVFFQMEEKKVNLFFQTIINNPQLYFLASSISSSYNVFLDNFGTLKNWFKDSAIISEINIPIISKDKDKENIRTWLNNNFPTQKGETIGDYIPGLNNYVEQIVENLYEKTEERSFGTYISSFFKASQVNSLFRRTSPLFIPIMIMQKEYEEETKIQFKQNCTTCINYLIDKNCIWVRDGNTSIRLSEKVFDFEEINEYDEEEMLSIIPVRYTYSLNELVWEAILKKEEERRLADKEELFSYCIDNEDDVKIAIKAFYNTFPTANSLQRILPRIPSGPNQERCREVAWKYVHGKIKNFAKQTPDSESVKLTYSMLLGRAGNWKEVQNLLQEMTDSNVELNGNTIGELYRFAHNYSSDRTVLSFIENLQKKHDIPDSLYVLFRKMELYTHTFQKAVIFFKEHGLADKIKPYAESPSSLEYMDAQKIFRHLSMLTESYDDWKIMLQLYDKASLEISNANLYSFVKSTQRNSNRLKEICNLFLINKPVLQTSIKEQHYELMIAYLIMNSPDFETSIYFYDINYECSHKDNFRLLALSFKNCKGIEYQKAVQYINKVEERVKAQYPESSISPIVYNQLLGIAPTQDDASYFFKRIERGDDFTLCNLLKDILRASSEDEKRFIYAYELINRPLFRPLRDDIHVVAILFNLATHPGHEEYIFSMINQDLGGGNEAKAMTRIINSSNEISSMRIRKPYRSLQDAYDLFLQIRKQYLSNSQTKVASDIYSTISNKINAERKYPKLREEYRKKWIAIVQKDDDIILKDEHFYSTVYRFYKLDSVVCDGKISQEFQLAMEGVKAEHSKTFNNILLALKFSYNFNTMKVLYEYYISWFNRSGKPKYLSPDHRTYTYLLEAVQTVEEALYIDRELFKYQTHSPKLNETIHYIEQKFNIRFENYKSDRSHSYFKQKREEPSLIHNQLRSGKMTTEEILHTLAEHIMMHDFVTPSILNSAITGIFKERNRSKSIRYQLLMKFINQYHLSKSFTQYTYMYLIKLSPDFGEVQRWLPMTDSVISEVLYGSLACNFMIAQSDISINREYFARWENIYKELHFEYGLESCWATMAIYLRIEAEGMEHDPKTAIPILIRLIETFYTHKRMLKQDTFMNVSLDYIINQIEIHTGNIEKWEEIRRFYS